MATGVVVVFSGRFVVVKVKLVNGLQLFTGRAQHLPFERDSLPFSTSVWWRSPLPAGFDDHFLTQLPRVVDSGTNVSFHRLTDYRKRFRVGKS